MKVVVCGAGQVGYNIARHLASERNDVTLIGQCPELVRSISDTRDSAALWLDESTIEFADGLQLPG